MGPAFYFRALVLIALLHRPVEPALRASFDADECAFNATHIVIATEGQKIDGMLDILESWKGDLKKGDRISVPELACFASDEARDIFRGLGERSPKRVSGSRMLLFLVKTPLLVGPTPKPDAPPSRERERWDSANGQGQEMKVSVAWIEDGEVYAFVQVFNPGQSVLVHRGTEKAIKARSLQVLAVRESVDMALQNQDASKCAEALTAFRDSDVYPAKCVYEEYGVIARALTKDGEWARTGLSGGTFTNYSFWCQIPILIPFLGTKGSEAASILSAIVQKNVNLDRYSGSMVKALAMADPRMAPTVLMSLLEGELAFWKAESPKLKDGWVNAYEPTDPEEYPPPIKYRCWKLMELLNALEKINSPDTKKAVSAFKDFWRSTPILERELPQASLNTP